MLADMGQYWQDTVDHIEYFGWDREAFRLVARLSYELDRDPAIVRRDLARAVRFQRELELELARSDRS